MDILKTLNSFVAAIIVFPSLIFTQGVTIFWLGGFITDNNGKPLSDRLC